MTKLINKNCRIKNFYISFYSIILGLDKTNFKIDHMNPA
jgi:hypothetical protein